MRIALLVAVVVVVAVAVSGGCAPAERPDDARYRIGGRVRGMWDGAAGLGLRLEGGGVEALLTATANGAFRFPDEIASGASYTVTVAITPASHTCAVDENASGVVAAADVANVSIACTGPEVAVALSGNDGWRFDPALDRQTFAGSILVQDVALTVSGAQLSGAVVDGAAAMLGRATSPIALPLGSRMVSVTVASGGLSKTYELVFDRGGSVLDQIAYGKASNAGAGDAFGNKVALSGDTLAVAAVAETSGAHGVNGDQADNSTEGAGAVYVFVRSGATWTQQAYLKASNTGRGDSFGCSLALSGNTLAVGASSESSDASGVNGNEADDSAPQAGAVYVFVRTGTTWAQQAYVKASNPHDLGKFGTSLALSGDTLAVGSTGERSAARGINGDQRDTSAVDAGAVYVFIRSGTAWTQQVYIKASDSAANFKFGESVALDGNTLAVGAVGGRATYVFVRTAATWTEQARVAAPNQAAFFAFGASIALSGDTLAVGAPSDDSAARGIDGDAQDASAPEAGAVYVFVRSGTTWTQQAYVKASNTGSEDRFGTSVALSGDTLAVGAIDEDSAATGPGGDQDSDAAAGAGAVYVFVRNGLSWGQRAYVKPTNTGAGDQFGSSLALSGRTLVIGASVEASAATGIGGNQADNSAAGAGAIYVFR
jgi:hypothetical protein